MDLDVKWRQDFEEVECADKNTRLKKLPKPIWHNFDTSDIIFHSRNYVINLFSLGTPVRIRENGKYVVNTTDLFYEFNELKKPVKMLKDCKPSSESLEKVGFLND